MLNQVKWATYRTVFLIYVCFFTLTGGLGGYLLAPLSSYYFFNDLNFLKYHRYFFPLAKTCWHFVHLWLTSEDYRREFSLNFAAPPRSSPDLELVKLADTWDAELFDCNQCIKCCLMFKCSLLDKTSRRCLAYDSFYWRYFACGRYPINQQQIDYYGCPKWVMRD